MKQNFNKLKKQVFRLHMLVLSMLLFGGSMTLSAQGEPTGTDFKARIYKGLSSEDIVGEGYEPYFTWIGKPAGQSAGFNDVNPVDSKVDLNQHANAADAYQIYGRINQLDNQLRTLVHVYSLAVSPNVEIILNVDKSGLRDGSNMDVYTKVSAENVRYQNTPGFKGMIQKGAWNALRGQIIASNSANNNKGHSIDELKSQLIAAVDAFGAGDGRYRPDIEVLLAPTGYVEIDYENDAYEFGLSQESIGVETYYKNKSNNADYSNRIYAKAIVSRPVIKFPAAEAEGGNLFAGSKIEIITGSEIPNDKLSVDIEDDNFLAGGFAVTINDANLRYTILQNDLPLDNAKRLNKEDVKAFAETLLKGEYKLQIDYFAPDSKVEEVFAKAITRPLEIHNPKVTITFIAGAKGNLEGELSVEVYQGSQFSEINIPTPTANTGYKFHSWSPELPEATSTVDEDATYKAIFKPIIPTLGPLNIPLTVMLTEPTIVNGKMTLTAAEIYNYGLSAEMDLSSIWKMMNQIIISQTASNLGIKLKDVSVTGGITVETTVDKKLTVDITKFDVGTLNTSIQTTGSDFMKSLVATNVNYDELSNKLSFTFKLKDELKALEISEMTQNTTTSFALPAGSLVLKKETDGVVAGASLITEDSKFVGGSFTMKVDLGETHGNEVEATILINSAPVNEASVKLIEMVTITFAAGTNGSLDGETTAVVEKGSLFGDITVPTPKPNDGYEFHAWAPALPTGETEVNANASYTAKFVPIVTDDLKTINIPLTIEYVESSIIGEYPNRKMPLVPSVDEYKYGLSASMDISKIWSTMNSLLTLVGTTAENTDLMSKIKMTGEITIKTKIDSKFKVDENKFKLIDINNDITASTSTFMKTLEATAVNYNDTDNELSFTFKLKKGLTAAEIVKIDQATNQSISFAIPAGSLILESAKPGVEVGYVLKTEESTFVNGKLRAEIESVSTGVPMGADITINSTNVKEDAVELISPATASIEGLKTLNDAPVTIADKFEFGVFKEGITEAVATAKNDTEGKFKITIENLIVGTHNYTLKEIGTAPAGYTYDTKVYNVEVVVKLDATTNKLESVVTIKDGDTVAKEVIFTNKYTNPEPTSVVISGVKTLNGLAVNQADKFEFGVFKEGITEAVATAKNDAEGKFKITLENLIAGTHNYTLKEIGTAPAGYTYDTKVYNVEVVVKLNEATNTLETVVTIKDGENTIANPSFNNIYAAPTPISAELSGKKILSGKTLEAGMFSFELLNSDETVHSTVSHDLNGDFKFTISDLKAAGTYKYSVKEKFGSKPGYTYDTKVYNVEVEVSLDAATNKLTAAVKVTNGPVVFNNKYTDILALEEVSETPRLICEGAEVNLTDYVKLTNPKDYVNIVAYKKGETQVLSSTKVIVNTKTTYVLKAHNKNTSEEGNGIEIEIDITPKAVFTDVSQDKKEIVVGESVTFSVSYNPEANAIIEWFDDKGNKVSEENTAKTSSFTITNNPESHKGVKEYTVKLTDACSGVVTEKTFAFELFLDADITILQKNIFVLSVNNNSKTNGGYNFAEYTWYKIPNIGDKPELATGNTNSQNYTPDRKKKISLDLNALYQVELKTDDGRVLRTPGVKVKQIGTFIIDFLVYPNPAKANSEVTVKIENFIPTDFEGATINVYSTLGVLKHSIEIKGDETTFTLKDKGVYYIHIKSEVFDASKTIIIE